MLTHPEALAIIMQSSKILNALNTELSNALHCVLAEDIVYDINMPPFDKSAMDGYACARADIGNELGVVEVIFAGKKPEKELLPGQCAKIMTGAPLPKGADMVFMQEDAVVEANNKVKCINLLSKTNVCYQGEDIRMGDVVVPKNTLLQPKHLPLLAGAGYHKVLVYQKPNVAVLTTGTELVEPDQKPLPHQIRNSNASQILGQLAALNIQGNYLGIVKDDEVILRKTMEQAIIDSDLLMMSGGVSVGEYDLVPDILRSLGFNIEVDKTAIQPGKPMVFAHRNGKYVFGLSGNPVASFIQYELYVKPFLYSLQACNYKPLRFQLPLSKAFVRKNSARYLFVPAQITKDNTVEPIQFHGSAHIGALCHADCLIEMPIGSGHKSVDDLVYIRPLV